MTPTISVPVDTATATVKQGFYQEDNIVRLELERLLTDLRERGKSK